jgi:HSP20 family protein
MPFYPPNVSDSFPERRDRDDPFRELEELNDRMGALLGRSLGEERGLRVSEGWTPLVDIEETDEAWVFEADLPGIKGEDVDIQVRDSEPSVAGEVKEREHTGRLRRQMRRSGRFEYRVNLPPNARSEDIDARLGHGVLTVSVPKEEGAEARRIEVRAD